MYLNTQFRIEGGAFDPIIVWRKSHENDEDDDEDAVTMMGRMMGIYDLYVKLVSLEDIVGLSAPPVHHCPGQDHTLISSALSSSSSSAPSP